MTPFSRYLSREPDPEQERWLGSKEGHLGHPTAPGPPDPSRPRRGRPSPGNGVPGVPLRPPVGRTPGMLPGMSPSGPRKSTVEKEEETP